MRADLWRTFLWQAASAICYLVGMGLFIFVAIDVYASPPADSFENFGWIHGILILISLGMMILSGGILFRYRQIAPSGMGPIGGMGPSSGETSLPSEFNRVGSRPPSNERDDTDDLDEGGERGISCPSCNVRNEKGYRFCRSCSSELPQ